MLCDQPETIEKYKAVSSNYICGKYNWDDVTAQTLALYGKGKA